MAGYRKKKKPHQKEKPLFGKDFVCFFALVKETVKACGPYKFVIIDKPGKKSRYILQRQETHGSTGKS